MNAVDKNSSSGPPDNASGPPAEFPRSGATRTLRFWTIALGAVAFAFVGRTALFGFANEPSPRVLGGTATITEANSGVQYTARVDTGAAVSSVHVVPEDMEIVDASSEPTENIAKTVRLRLDNGAGKEAWVETEITGYVEVRNAERAEHRYRVRLPLQCGDVVKDVVVNLNDRSSMSYRFLLGRDFLENDFLVDVSHEGPEPLNANDTLSGG